ncbi:hypothetical protein GR211_29920 [Rhizobium leguminosarum]|uniref:hypothetical protein n=1 Tax=Rhizobium ruizarguesonis TaxID=2081791 RepID=UPI0013BB4610|nr:hypothetical protein [Rhizobium ruizarguesonis]NEJ17156.1 hypothetical protein [Rhizobium ruizarguesonis]NEK31077.1 hypothetical protein [Rhizobium ruizarguesonis]
MEDGLGRRRVAGLLAMAVTTGLLTTAPGSEGFACGYENPQDVSRGSLNWSYPDSLHVIGAISREVAARRLPLANFDQPSIDLFGHRFKLAAISLAQFGAMLRTATSQPLRMPVAVVLVEPMLWARFEPMGDGLHTAVHISGPERGDLVVITGEAVIAEIAAGHLTLGQAYARGVMRLYGDVAKVAVFVRDHQQVGGTAVAFEPATSDAAGTKKDGENPRRASQYSPYAGREPLPIKGKDSSDVVSNLSSQSRPAD